MAATFFSGKVLASGAPGKRGGSPGKMTEIEWQLGTRRHIEAGN
jgi:hypothetical protein